MPNTLPVPLLPQQNDGDCLPTCVEMITAYWGKHIARQDLIELFDTDPAVGTPAGRVLRLQTMGWAVVLQPASENDFRQWLAQQIPVILLVDTGELPYWSRRCAHAVVLVSIAQDTTIVNDPAFAAAPISVSLGDLLLASDAMDNLALAITPG